MPTAQGLVPMYDSDHEAMHRLPRDHPVLVTIKRPRNYKFHKKFFALLRLTIDNIPDSFGITTIDELLVRIKIDLGLCDVVIKDRLKYIVPHSISFAAMDEEEFNATYNAARSVILNKYLYGLKLQDLEDNINQYF